MMHSMYFEAALPNNFQSKDWPSFSCVSGRKLLYMRGPGLHPTSLALLSEPSSAWVSCFFHGLRFRVAGGGSSHSGRCGLCCSPKSCKFRFRQQPCSFCRRQTSTSSFAHSILQDERGSSTPFLLRQCSCLSKGGRRHRVSGLESGCLAKSCKKKTHQQTIKQDLSPFPAGALRKQHRFPRDPCSGLGKRRNERSSRR